MVVVVLGDTDRTAGGAVMRLDTERLIRYRRGARISRRALAKACGQTLTTVASLEETGDAAHLPCSTVERLASALGVHVSDLLHVPAEEPPDSDGVDAEIGAALAAAGPDGLTTDALAVALAVTGAEVAEAVDRLRPALKPSGMTVSSTSGRLRLAPVSDGRVTDESLEAAENRARIRAAADREVVRTVYALLHDRCLADVVPNERKRRIDRGKLVNGGLIEPTKDGKARLTDDVLYSLLMD